jgi:hypothetical protein
MPDYVTIAAKIEATGAALTACQLEARLIYRPNPPGQEVTPTPTTP